MSSRNGQLTHASLKIRIRGSSRTETLFIIIYSTFGCRNRASGSMSATRKSAPTLPKIASSQTRPRSSTTTTTTSPQNVTATAARSIGQGARSGLAAAQVSLTMKRQRRTSGDPPGQSRKGGDST